jgi:hypothetical protein
MKTLAEGIRETVKNLQEGTVLSPKEFLHLGSRAAVDQILSRLARQGDLLRIARGLYAAPVIGRFGKRPPSPQKLLSSLAEKTGEVIVPHGAAAANQLGLTTQVPVKEVYLTSGSSRTLRMERRTVELRHAPSWQLLFGDSSAGTLLRSLAWAGSEQVKNFLPHILKTLPKHEWKTLFSVRSRLPVWLARVVSEVAQRA